MFKIFNKMARSIRQSFEGLSEDMPDIEWAKILTNHSTIAFTAQYNARAAAKISGEDIVLKAKDGRIFTHKRWDKPSMWHGKVEGEYKTFRSPYLDSVVALALEKGLKPQPSAYDIMRQTIGPGSQRHWLIWNGTDEEVANLNITHPTAPTGFKDHHTPEDFDESHPHFAAYLRKKGYVPFRLNGSQSNPSLQPK